MGSSVWGFGLRIQDSGLGPIGIGEFGVDALANEVEC